MATPKEKDGSLKRLGGGRWQTHDERFTIEPQSGTWVVVDAQQTDDLGLPLVRGPFTSLGAAKAAIATARDSEPAVSPLAAKVATLRDRKDSAPPGEDDRPRGRSAASKPKPTKPEPRTKSPAQPVPPPEPRWLRDLDPGARRDAILLIDRLTDAGALDPEGTAHRDIVGKVPAAAAFAIARALKALGPEARPPEVARLLSAGRDPQIGVRWRLVDGDERPITLDLDPRARR
jgi:hypothetical protein